jgi:hypothetical protein
MPIGIPPTPTFPITNFVVIINILAYNRVDKEIVDAKR